MKRYMQLFIFAAFMSIPTIASADEGSLLSTVTKITKDPVEPQNLVTKTTEAVSRTQDTAVKTVEKAKPVVNQTTGTLKTVADVVPITETVDKVTDAVPVKETVKTVTDVVPVKETLETVKETAPLVEAKLPSVKVDVEEHEVEVNLPVSKTEVNVDAPVVLGAVDTEPAEVPVKEKPVVVPVKRVKEEKPQPETVKASVKPVKMQKQLETASQDNMKRSGEKPKQEDLILKKKAPVKQKPISDYPDRSQMISVQPPSGQAPAGSNSGSSNASSGTAALWAVLDGADSEILSADVIAHTGTVRNYHDQWQNAPPGQPPQSFFFL